MDLGVGQQWLEPILLYLLMLTTRQEELLVKGKLKTEERVTTLRHIKMDMTEFGKMFLDTAIIDRPIKLPFIKKKSNPLAQEFCSSRSSNHNSSHFINQKTLKTNQNPISRKDRSSSLISATFQKQNLKKNNDRSLENMNKYILDDDDRDPGKRQRKPLPRITKHKYFRNCNDKIQRIMSQKNVAKVQENPQSRYKIGAILGQGAYATVRLGKADNGFLVAVKCYDKSRITDDQKLENIKRQIRILRKVSHPGIIQLLDVTQTNHQINIVTELIENTSLLDLLKANIAQKIPEAEARPLFRQLVQAVLYLHNKNIVHRDIKLQNVLVTKSNQVKLIDFGFSSDCSLELYAFCGTPSYISPEMILKNGYGKSVDVWALGVTLYKMICGHFPYKAVSHKALYFKVLKGNLKFGPGVSVNAQILLSKMLCVDSCSRVSLEEALQEEWWNQS